MPLIPAAYNIFSLTTIAVVSSFACRSALLAYVHCQASALPGRVVFSIWTYLETVVPTAWPAAAMEVGTHLSVRELRARASRGRPQKARGLLTIKAMATPVHFAHAQCEADVPHFKRADEFAG